MDQVLKLFQGRSKEQKTALAAAAAATGLALYVACSKSRATQSSASSTATAVTAAVSVAHAEAPKRPKSDAATKAHIEELRVKTSSQPISLDELKTFGDLNKFVSFSKQYGTRLVARPDVDEGELVRVTDWKLLTPENYDRTGFHFEVDVRGTSFEHLVNGSQGKALAVYATNDPNRVRDFLQAMKLDPRHVVAVDEIAPQAEDNMTAVTTVEKLFTQYLDLFGRPTREFLKKLAPFAYDIMEKVAIAELTLDRKLEEFQDRAARAMTFADYMLEFKSLQIPVDKYVDLIPTIKQRVYSICSSSDYRPGRCQLLVVREDWQAKGGETKFGLCSSFLTFARSGYVLAHVLAHSTHSVMQMPADQKVHIFMAGLGTGLAPFRAFVEQRQHEKSQGQRVGPMTLFFGGRHAHAEYYYRDEFEAFEREGLVKCCNAWSRDQAHKIYVQHKIAEEAESIWRELGVEGSTGCFFLCGSKQPEKDVFAALLKIFKEHGNMTAEQAQARMDDLQAAGRYVTAVY